VGEDQSVSAASRTFLDRVFGGSLKPMLAHFVENQGLSREELEDLRQILKETPAAKNNESGRKSCKP
jgi:BlaI family penicillinase repressor